MGWFRDVHWGAPMLRIFLIYKNIHVRNTNTLAYTYIYLFIYGRWKTIRHTGVPNWNVLYGPVLCSREHCKMNVKTFRVHHKTWSNFISTFTLLSPCIYISYRSVPCYAIRLGQKGKEIRKMKKKRMFYVISVCNIYYSIKNVVFCVCTL